MITEIKLQKGDKGVTPIPMEHLLVPVCTTYSKHLHAESNETGSRILVGSEDIS